MSDVVPGPTAGLDGTAGPLHQGYDLVLLDLDGVVYIGPNAVPRAAESLDAVRAAGLPVRFVTNNASRTARMVAQHLTDLGIPATAAEVVTSSQVAAAILARRLAPGSGVLVVGGVGLRQALEDQSLVPMDSVDEGPAAVVQGFSQDVGWRNLAEASRAVRSGLFWMATNLDQTFPTAHGPAPGNGALVQAVATAAGRGPDDVAGKPRPAAFLEAARAAGATRPLVVGDRLDTDLEGAHAADMPGLLVLTGVTDVSTLLVASADLRPTYLGRDLRCLMEPHPAATVTALETSTLAGAVEGRCLGACVTAEIVADRVAVRVVTPGDDPVDLLRAAAVVSWYLLDTGGPRPVDASAVIDAVRAAEPGATWAR